MWPTPTITSSAGGDNFPVALTSGVSRKVHGGVSVFDSSLALSGTPTVECRTGGVNGDHPLVLTFNHDLARASVGVTGGGTSSVASAYLTVPGTQIWLDLAGVTDAQTLTLTLSNVADNLGQMLPDTAVNISFLLGDTNADGTVNAGDAIQTRSRSGQQADTTNFRFDINLDGSVNGGDTIVVRSRSGSGLSGAVSGEQAR